MGAPRVGDIAPDFTLRDTNGNEVTLSSFRSDKIIYLVFNRGFV